MSTTEKAIPRTAADLVAEAKSKIVNLTVDEVAAELKSREVLLVEELVEKGRIPGSTIVPRGMIEFRAATTSPYHQDGFDPDRRVILHCASGAGRRWPRPGLDRRRSIRIERLRDVATLGSVGTGGPATVDGTHRATTLRGMTNDQPESSSGSTPPSEPSFPQARLPRVSTDNREGSRPRH